MGTAGVFILGCSGLANLLLFQRQRWRGLGLLRLSLEPRAKARCGGHCSRTKLAWARGLRGFAPPHLAVVLERCYKATGCPAQLSPGALARAGLIGQAPLRTSSILPSLLGHSSSLPLLCSAGNKGFEMMAEAWDAPTVLVSPLLLQGLLRHPRCTNRQTPPGQRQPLALDPPNKP